MDLSINSIDKTFLLEKLHILIIKNMVSKKNSMNQVK